jgi:hypothetical protein
MNEPNGRFVLIRPITEIVRRAEDALLLSAKDLTVRAKAALPEMTECDAKRLRPPAALIGCQARTVG